jgi:hypothetical protein
MKTIMKICATNKTALLTGLYGGLLGMVVGPNVDTGSSVWLVVAAIAFATPAYFFVFDVRRADMVGLWILKPALLKRLALCCSGAVFVCTLAQIGFIVWSDVLL